MRTLAVLLGLVLVATPAAACSLVEGAKGFFEVRDLASGESVSVRAHPFITQPDCRLANPHAVSGEDFAWAHGDRVRIRGAAGDWEAHVGGPVEAMSGMAGGFLVRRGSVVLHLTPEGATPIPSLPSHPTALLGPGRVALLDWNASRLSLYDADLGTWVARDEPLAPPLVAGPPATLGARWLIAPTSQGMWAWDLRDGTDFNVTHPLGPEWPRWRTQIVLGIDGDHAYFFEWMGHQQRLLRASLPAGPTEVVEEGLRGVVSVQGGKLVLGYPRGGPGSMLGLPTVGMELLVVLLGLAAVRRRAEGTGRDRVA